MSVCGACRHAARELTRLTALSFASNRLRTPNIDLSRFPHLHRLDLGGNPLTWFPELAAAPCLHALSLATLAISADKEFRSFTVALPKAPARIAPMRGNRDAALDELMTLLFCRSSCAHPLLAGGLAEMAREQDVRAAILRNEKVLPQVMNMLRVDDAVVSMKACEALWQLAEEAGAAEALIRAEVVSAIHKLMAGHDADVQLASLQVCRRDLRCSLLS